jgi:nucleoid-associated protein YgaU
MAVSIRKRSRLQFGNLITTDGFTFWDLLELPTIAPQPDDTLYQVRGNDRIDLLAYNFYGDPVLWWVIAAANDLELLPSDLNVGDTLRIPSQRYVLQVLFQKSINSK